jgi:hypothetical protein
MNVGLLAGFGNFSWAGQVVHVSCQHQALLNAAITVIMELIRSLAVEHDGLSIFCGVGERSREGRDLHGEMQDSAIMHLGNSDMSGSPWLEGRNTFANLEVSANFNFRGQCFSLASNRL